jgi:hypothetical protein
MGECVIQPAVPPMGVTNRHGSGNHVIQHNPLHTNDNRFD